MYAVIESGGKQHRVAVGELVELEKLNADDGKAIEFDKVLMVVDNGEVSVGKPYLQNVKVKAEVVDNYRGKKIRVLKFKRRKNYLKTQGHRQWHTKVKITAIEAA